MYPSFVFRVSPWRHSLHPSNNMILHTFENSKGKTDHHTCNSQKTSITWSKGQVWGYIIVNIGKKLLYENGIWLYDVPIHSQHYVLQWNSITVFAYILLWTLFYLLTLAESAVRLRHGWVITYTASCGKQLVINALIDDSLPKLEHGWLITPHIN